MGCVQSKQSVRPDLPQVSGADRARPAQLRDFTKWLFLQAKLRVNVSATPSTTESSTPSSEECIYQRTNSAGIYNEPDRLASVAALGCLGTHPDQRFITITK